MDKMLFVFLELNYMRHIFNSQLKLNTYDIPLLNHWSC